MNSVQFSLSNNSVNSYHNIFEDFYKQYYSKMSMGGYPQSLFMFDPNAKCIFNSDPIDNPYNLSLKIASQGIHRFNYYHVNASYVPTGEGILVNSVSTVSPVNNNNYLGSVVKTSETFNIKYINGKCHICDYIIKFF